MTRTLTEELLGLTHVTIVRGSEIAQEEADAVIVAVSSSGLCFDEATNAIRKAGGQMFFNQLAKEDLFDGKVVFTHGPAFQNVIFVIDDLKTPLGELVKKGLAEADTRGFQTVSLPDMRVITRNVVGKTMAELHAEMIEGAREYLAGAPNTNLRYIKFVFRD